MSDTQKPLYFFLHVPRTGGTSLHVTMNTIYGARYIRILDDTIENNDKLVFDVLKNEPYKYDVITSHVSGFGVHELCERPMRYMTILREPTARMLSRYYKVLRNENDRHYALLTQYGTVEEGLKHLSSNLQTRQIAGVKDNDRDITDADLETAKRNLEAWFDVVLILERFEDSLLLMRRALGWKRPVIMPLHRNAGHNRPKETAESIREAAADYNRYDIALYRFGSELMDRRIAEQGAAFQRDKLELWARRKTRQAKALVRQRLINRDSKS